MAVRWWERGSILQFARVFETKRWPANRRTRRGHFAPLGFRLLISGLLTKPLPEWKTKNRQSPVLRSFYSEDKLRRTAFALIMLSQSQVLEYRPFLYTENRLFRTIFKSLRMLRIKFWNFKILMAKYLLFFGKKKIFCNFEIRLVIGWSNVSSDPTAVWLTPSHVSLTELRYLSQPFCCSVTPILVEKKKIRGAVRRLKCTSHESVLIAHKNSLNTVQTQKILDWLKP